jgi:hypothetical protein
LTAVALVAVQEQERAQERLEPAAAQLYALAVQV